MMLTRRRFRRPLASLAALLAAGGLAAADMPAALPSFERVMNLAAPRDVGDLRMLDQDGARRSLADLRGAPALVYFGFTRCPDACPTALGKLAQIQAARAKEFKRVRIVLISVDGERDTPAAMKTFLRQFSPDFIGLTAPPAEVRELALRFAAPFFKDPVRNGEYLVQHSPRVYALDKHGRLRAELYDASAEATVGVVRALMAE